MQADHEHWVAPNMNGKLTLARVTLLLSVWACSFTATSLTGQESQTQTFLQTLQNAKSATQKEDWNNAAGLWGEVVKANPVNSEFFQEWGKALYKIRDYSNAVAADKKVLELGPPEFVADICYDIARNYALMGNTGESLAWLDRAWEHGWRDLEKARKDDDLKSLRSEGHVQDLIGSVNTNAMTREQGWRYDLHFLEREIYRRSPDPFRHSSHTVFEKTVSELDSEIPKLRDDQIIVELLRIMTLVGDGHSIATFGSARPELRKSVPVEFYWFKDGLYIVSADQAHKDLIGKQVLRVNGHPIAEVLEALKSEIPRDNAMWLQTIAPIYMRIPELLSGLGLIPRADALALSLRDANGQESQATISSEDLALQQIDPDFPAIWFVLPQAARNWTSLPELNGKPIPLYLKHPEKSYWFEYLEQQKVLYFQFNLILDDPKEPLNEFLDGMFEFLRQHDVAKMVIDLRENPGGDTTLVKPLIAGIIQSKINQHGKLFVIIGRRTFSAAMNTSVFLERNTEAIFVGEPTGSSPNFVGETIPVRLPYSGLLPCVSDLYWETSWPWDHREWIAPLLYTPPTFAAYQQNRDPAMEAIAGYGAQ